MLKKISGLLVWALMANVGVAAQEAIPRQVFVPYWSISDGYESTFRLHNNLLHESLLVRPVLLSPAGTRTELPVVEVGPLEVATVNVRAALGQARRHTRRTG